MKALTWQDELQNSITSIKELKPLLQLNDKEVVRLEDIVKKHPFLITRYYMGLINPNDPLDPIRNIAIPSLEEISTTGVFDTSGELKSTKTPGLQHKYRQTALLLLTNRCGMYCRFCFRKRLVGVKTKEILHNFDVAVDYIAEHHEINNVLISGGDPLILESKLLGELLGKLSSIDHLKFIRIGTRIPVVLPNRIIKDPSLLSMFNRYSTPEKRVYIVTQFDHPREITPSSTRAIHKLIQSGVIVSNQTTLLKGVNDDPVILADLQNNLTRIGAIPYYIFQCRPVKRVKSKFQLSLRKALDIVEEAKEMMNGHSKRFKFCMSHDAGKIEIIGTLGDDILFKFHQARDPEMLGRVFSVPVATSDGWLDDIDLTHKDMDELAS